MTLGDLPDVVLHTCDNPSCVNPNHLRGGTQQDNVDDMFTKGRANKATGIRTGKAKLTEAQVVEIRGLRANTSQTLDSIGARFGVSAATVSLVARGLLWKHVGGGQ